MFRKIWGWLFPSTYKDVTGRVMYVVRPIDAALATGRACVGGSTLVLLEDGTEGCLDASRADEACACHVSGPMEATIRVEIDGWTESPRPFGVVIGFGPVTSVRSRTTRMA